MVNYGDVVILDFDPSAGLEIQKRRPAVVVSNDTFNATTRIRLLCPITHTNRLYTIELPKEACVDEYVLVQQIKALDVNARNAKVIGHLNNATMAAVTNMLKLIL